MRRNVAVIWHAAFSFLAAWLYFFFVLPRWFELTGATPHVLGTVLRIVVALLVALSALPVAFTLLRTRKPEYGTPQLALRLLVGSIVAHITAGVLILGTAISEIWLSLDQAGPVLFGIYGAAAAIALLGNGMFYLSFVAEMPPPPPKPIKPNEPKQPKRRRSRKGKDSAGAGEEEPESTDGETVEAETPTAESKKSRAAAKKKAPAVAEPESTAVEAEPIEATADGTDETQEVDATEELVSTGGRHETARARKTRTGVRHKMPSGKRRTGRDT